MKTTVRFAPSPTGYLHIGGLRTALYNYIYAQQTKGDIILRIEDTDQSRKVDNAVDNLINIFDKLDIQFSAGPHVQGDKGPYHQSERLSIYNEHIKILINSNKAYPCFCSEERLDRLRTQLSKNKLPIKYDRKCTSISKNEAFKKMQSDKYVIRMKIPHDEEIVFYDKVRDKVVVNSSELDDQILIKSDGFPTYHFANVVDDHLMEITHVMRGEEWLPSTPKHILLYRFFNWEVPKFIHLPLLLNSDKSKLSKRQGDVAVEDYINKGYLKEAIINFVSLLGWHPNNDKEIMNIKYLINNFSINRIQKSGAVFDIDKLNWINEQYLRALPIEEIANRARPFFHDQGFDLTDNEKYIKAVDNGRQRVSTLFEIPDKCKMFFDDIILKKEYVELINNNKSQKLLELLYRKIDSKSNLDGLEFKKIIDKIGIDLNISGKDLFFPIRIVLYGDSKGPDLPIIYSILGKNLTLERLAKFKLN